ncbi:hypothetical protein JCM11641_004996 [Rhodosporidiobolus odoratus]
MFAVPAWRCMVPASPLAIPAPPSLEILSRDPPGRQLVSREAHLERLLGWRSYQLLPGDFRADGFYTILTDGQCTDFTTCYAKGSQV